MSGILIVYDNTCISTTGASCSWTVPTGTYQVTFEIWGGGGGGGVATSEACDCCTRGGPGSGGSYSKVSIATTPGTVYAVCAGAAGVATSGYGSLVALCCRGCTGGTSYVNGTGLTNLCATGGVGGCSDFNTNCYSHNGCNWRALGPSLAYGYGGDVVANGVTGVTGKYGSTSPSNIFVIGGSAGGPGGGAGGANISYCSGLGCATIGEHPLHGRVPGGGGAGSGYWACCTCNTWNSGRGGPGMVKITY